MSSVAAEHVSTAPRLTALPDTLPGKAMLVVAASGFVAICAHVSIPLVFTPVPLTLQTFAVLLVGLVLGPAAGFSAMILYLAEGVAGLPVFSPHGPGGLLQLLGPTGGFLFSYPLAAAAAGAVARRLQAVASPFAAALAGGVAGSLFIFTLGAGRLAQLLHLSLRSACTLAVFPFLMGEAIKVTAAAGIFSKLGRRPKS